MMRKKPCADDVLNEKTMHSPQPTNLAFQKEIRWHRRVGDDRLNGWLLRPAGEPVCRDPPVGGHHMAFFPQAFPCAPKGASDEMPEFYIKLPLEAPLLIFHRSYLLKSFPHGDTSARHRGFEMK